MRSGFRGIVLAGGKSSRFGEDKALATMNGKTLLETAVNRLKGVGLCVTVITNRARDYSCLGLECDIQRDMIEERGPLGGLYTACRLFPRQALLVTTCDMPAVTAASMKELSSRHKRESLVTLFSMNGADLPFPGIYESALEDFILSYIQQNRLSMSGLLAQLPSIHRLQGFCSDELFININKRKDFEDYLRDDSRVNELHVKKVK